MTRTTEKPQGGFLTRLVRKQIFIPLAALLILIVFNLIADPSFFAVTLKENSLGDLVLTGNLITILDNASELVILAIGRRRQGLIYDDQRPCEEDRLLRRHDLARLERAAECQ